MPEHRPVPGPPRSAPPQSGPHTPRPTPLDPTPPPDPTTPARSAEPTDPAVPPAVAAALAALDGVQQRPLEEHVDVFDAVHRGLQDALAALDER